jgi:hypothetical protein
MKLLTLPPWRSSELPNHDSAKRRVLLRGGLLAVCLICCCALAIQSAFAQDDDGVVNREYPLKALFLYNFGSYTEWPAGTFANDQTPFVIGVLGSSPLDETLNEIAAKKRIGDRRIVIERYKSAGDIKNCQILFIPRSVPQKQQQQVIDAMKNRPVLLVGESANFAANGGGINFFVEANKIRFEINVAATKQQQLKISSKLLAMAKLVGVVAPAPR